MINYDLIETNFWNKEEPLPSSSILMYTYILYRLKTSNETEVTISDTEMVKKLSITRPSLSSSRKILSSFNLISFNHRNGKPCRYSININIRKHEGSSKHQPNPKVSTKKNSKPTAILKESKPSQKPKNDFSSLLNENKNIPTWEVFLQFATTLQDYELDLNSKIREKYENWLENKWCNSLGRPITDWKIVLKKAMPFIKNNESSLATKIPKIQRPEI